MNCSICGDVFDKADDVAIHLVDDHGWDTERARLWLRDQIEEQAFYEEA